MRAKEGTSGWSGLACVPYSSSNACGTLTVSFSPGSLSPPCSRRISLYSYSRAHRPRISRHSILNLLHLFLSSFLRAMRETSVPRRLFRQPSAIHQPRGHSIFLQMVDKTVPRNFYILAKHPEEQFQCQRGASGHLLLVDLRHSQCLHFTLGTPILCPKP